MRAGRLASPLAPMPGERQASRAPRDPSGRRCSRPRPTLRAAARRLGYAARVGCRPRMSDVAAVVRRGPAPGPEHVHGDKHALLPAGAAPRESPGLEAISAPAAAAAARSPSATPTSSPCASSLLLPPRVLPAQPAQDRADAAAAAPPALAKDHVLGLLARAVPSELPPCSIGAERGARAAYLGASGYLAARRVPAPPPGAPPAVAPAVAFRAPPPPPLYDVSRYVVGGVDSQANEAPTQLLRGEATAAPAERLQGEATRAPAKLLQSEATAAPAALDASRPPAAEPQPTDTRTACEDERYQRIEPHGMASRVRVIALPSSRPPFHRLGLQWKWARAQRIPAVAAPSCIVRREPDFSLVNWQFDRYLRWWIRPGPLPLPPTPVRRPDDVDDLLAERIASSREWSEWRRTSVRSPLPRRRA